MIIKLGELIYALDWCHQSYKFDLRLINNGEWAIPAFSDGDYYIFLTQDLKNGFFGHP